MAGVTKKIKVFEYQSVVRNAGFTNHFPVHEMSCAARLSCVAYNPYHKQQLVSSDYEGCVCVWDTSIGRRTALHQEHGQRVWSVATLEPPASLPCCKTALQGKQGVQGAYALVRGGSRPANLIELLEPQHH